MLIVVGLDSFEITLLEKFVLKGSLPFITSVVEKSKLLNLESPAKISSGSTWDSINTGLNPGKHGYAFLHRQLKSGTYDIEKFYPGVTEVTYYWEYLKNLKKVIFDVPYSDISKIRSGIAVADWGTENKMYETRSYPKNLVNEIHKKYGVHPLVNWYHQKPKNVKEMNALIEKVNEGLNMRFAIINDLLKRDQWDLFHFCINEFHWLGHFIFDYIGDEVFENENALNEKSLSIVENVYKRVDNFLQTLVDRYPEASIVFLSNTGIKKNLSGRHMILPVLKAMELYPSTKNTLSLAAKTGSFAAANFENYLGANNIARIKKLIPIKFWDKMTRKIINSGSLWPQSLAFEIPGDGAGLIRINLIGREPKGKVEEKDYRAICEQVKEVFLELKHSESGKKVVKEVVINKDHYHGHLIDNLPDISIIWADEEPVLDIMSSNYGRFVGKLLDKRSGAHVPEAFIGFHNINRKLLEGNHKTECIAPTILKLLDTPIPENMDGYSLIE